MPTLEVVLGDLTTMEVDAVVNAANSSLMGGGGVDGAIHRAGGPTILAECREIVARQGGCDPGDAVATGAGDLPARWVVHTVGPIWNEQDPAAHVATLTSAYTRSLEVAAELGARSVAFPNISTGVYGFPRPLAADTAIAAVRSSSAAAMADSICFVCFDAENFGLYEDRLG